MLFQTLDTLFKKCFQGKTCLGTAYVFLLQFIQQFHIYKIVKNISTLTRTGGLESALNGIGISL